MDYAVCIIPLLSGKHISGQILRIGTSASLIYGEAICAESQLILVKKFIFIF